MEENKKKRATKLRRGKLWEGKNRRTDSKGEEVKVFMESKGLKVKLLCLLQGLILI